MSDGYFLEGFFRRALLPVKEGTTAFWMDLDELRWVELFLVSLRLDRYYESRDYWF